MDVRELDRRAMAVTARIVPKITADQLDLPTPCADWRVRDLLAHILGQYRGFALAATGARTELADFRPLPIGTDPAAEYAAAAEAVTTAFAADGVLDRALYLAEIRNGGPFPATMAIEFHLVDEVAHAWDLAVSVGFPLGVAEFGPDVLERALASARQIPDAPDVRGPGMAFGPGLGVPEDGSALDELLAVLGRDPAWTF